MNKKQNNKTTAPRMFVIPEGADLRSSDPMGSTENLMTTGKITLASGGRKVSIAPAA